jgi:hypothetical protein
MVYVTKAEYVQGYKIRLQFSDQREGIVDLESFIRNDTRPIVRQLENLAQFQDFRVDMDTVVWSNGLDLSPEYLWDATS